MSEIDRFRPDDRRGVDLLYRRTHGADAADAHRLRWDWQHRRNPYNPSGQPGIWVAREGPTVVGHYPTLPVRAVAQGARGRRRLGHRRDRGARARTRRDWAKRCSAPGIATAARCSPSACPPESRELLDRLHWPESHVVPCLVKPLTRRAVRLPHLPTPVNRLLSALMYPFVQVVARSRPLARRVRADPPLRHLVHDAVGAAGAEVRPRGPP